MRYPILSTWENHRLPTCSLDGRSSTFLDPFSQILLLHPNHVVNDEVFNHWWAQSLYDWRKTKKKYHRLDFSIVLMLNNSYNFDVEDVFHCFPVECASHWRPCEVLLCFSLESGWSAAPFSLQLSLGTGEKWEGDPKIDLSAEACCKTWGSTFSTTWSVKPVVHSLVLEIC